MTHRRRLQNRFPARAAPADLLFPGPARPAPALALARVQLPLRYTPRAIYPTVEWAGLFTFWIAALFSPD